MWGIIDHGLVRDISFEDLDDWEVMFLSESIVSRIMGRDGHDSAGSIGTKDVVGNIDRDGLAIYWVDGGSAKIDTGLLFLKRGSHEVALLGGVTNVLLHCFFLLGAHEFLNERMLWGEAAIGAAEKGIDTGCEDIEVGIFAFDIETDLDTG